MGSALAGSEGRASRRDRAFASERDDAARAAADEARAAVRAALAGAPPAELGKRVRLEAAECAAETAGAIAAVDRLAATEFRMLTRAWCTVVGPIGVATPSRAGARRGADRRAAARTSVPQPARPTVAPGSTMSATATPARRSTREATAMTSEPQPTPRAQVLPAGGASSARRVRGRRHIG